MFRPIHINPKHKGALHAQLGVPQGQPISLSALQAAKNSSNPVEAKRANFAINARGFRKVGPKKKPDTERGEAPDNETMGG